MGLKLFVRRKALRVSTIPQSASLTAPFAQGSLRVGGQLAVTTLCTREPGAEFTSAAYVKSAKVPTAAWPLWDVDNSVETV